MDSFVLLTQRWQSLKQMPLLPSYITRTCLLSDAACPAISGPCHLRTVPGWGEGVICGVILSAMFLWCPPATHLPENDERLFSQDCLKSHLFSKAKQALWSASVLNISRSLDQSRETVQEKWIKDRRQVLANCSIWDDLHKSILGPTDASHPF